jgi:hypothetical protein
MSDGFNEAKARRNWLERLGEKIPGYRGFQDRELRRDVDKLQREHLGRELERLKGAARERARGFADAGDLPPLALFDRLDRRLDGLAQGVRFADYGASGFFDAVKIGEAELDRLHQLDLSLVDDLEQLAADVAAVPAAGAGDPTLALRQALARLQTIEDKWAGRKSVVASVVRT